MTVERLNSFFGRFPLFYQTARALNEASIPFLIGGSGCLYLLGNERLPDDVDIFLPDAFHDQADKIFGIESYWYTSDQEKVRNSNPEQNHAIQLTSHLVITIAGKKYELSMTEEMLKQAREVQYEGLSIKLLPPEDVLMIKAILQRGADVGKHDLKDIETFLALYPQIDRAYLSKRILFLGAQERVRGLFGIE